MSAPKPPPEDGSPYFPISERAASLAVIHIGVTAPLLGVALCMFVARIWLRIRPVWRIGWEDYIMTIGVAAAIVDFGFLLPQMYTTSTLLTEDERLLARKYGFLAIPIWGIAMTFIKVSIAMMLLRIQPNLLWWRIFCGFIMGLQIVYGVGNTFFILLQCRPLEASWNAALVAAGEASCLPPIGIHIASNTGSGINISTDILLSLAPILFLWKLKRPIREKLLVGALMALGMFASVASIVKSELVKEFGKAEDGWALTNSIATWTALEQLLAMIASTAPFLKPFVESFLIKLGMDLGTTRTGPSSYGNRYHDLSGTGGPNSGRHGPQSKGPSTQLSAIDPTEDKNPFTTSTQHDIPLQDLSAKANFQTTVTARGFSESREAQSWYSNEDSKSDKQELVPTHKPRNGV